MSTAARLMLVALLCATGLAHAHSALVRAEPGQRAVITESPKLIRLLFNEPIEAAFSKVTVEAAGKPLADVGSPAIAPDNPRELVVSLPKLAPGKYQVNYRVLSVDGHVVEWSYGFTVSTPSPTR